MEDKNLTCEECSQDFVFSGDEQDFYASRGFQEPKRCKTCRDRRKEQFGSRGFGQRQMHPATCAECGIETTVPFKPREDRPVYCRDCYTKRR
tara:strand:- start:1464 stop:1739 length:276 start_codon:yes stop_codon:yes gene_type:complete